MKKRRGFLFLGLLLSGLPAVAKVPYGELEVLRRQSVAVRAALDNPATAQRCGLGPESLAPLGGGLELAIDQAASGWQKLTLTKEDVPALKNKVAICRERGSCQVYEKFLTSVKTQEAAKPSVAETQKSLGTTLEKLDSSTYQKAFRQISDGCGILKRMVVKESP